MSAKLVNYARIASNEEDIRRIAATGYKEAIKFFPEEKRPTSPERIYKKSFNKANKKTTAPNPDKLYSLTNRERNRYALGFYSRLIVTAGVQGQDIEASSDAEDRDIAINIISDNPLDPSPSDRCVQPYNFGYYNLTNTDINRQKGAQKEALLAATNLRRRLNPEFRKDKVTNMLANKIVSKKIPISIANLIYLIPKFRYLAA
ncbi:hypothetical protein L249_7098 [Ophiocordyceps polyrhachis-furcata BCC 54312]|uniref:Uncharacterized protein n=1 Tax=Ophiocordyceps polyrhachis-furcata BCC 54312 TaxID=1330021 RepID=A0A367LL95_9HYPO|nr:hypothetical protein L249_7098 [Ophiocordyceps polyrhachis-furcata BCC 54312]